MQKAFYSVAAILIFLILSAGVKAQRFAAAGKHLYKFSIAAARRHVPEAAPVMSHPKSRQYLNSINIRAVRDFMNRYNNVDNESWVIMEDGGFKAHYVANGIDYTAYYNKQGNWTNSLKIYTEEKLPFKVRDMVKREYYDYAIMLIHEIESFKSDSAPTYIIRMEDARSFFFIRIRDGEMNILKHLQKQE
ncbi:hypothetical protein [Agriterribacter sp.]|uniref:hypothetical protein n=1 Tax=Agriterribacter sp. TaxID=2821509 RepID=UPI002BD86FCB|nr:hypothetical protein [Agriterribacter sp.]HTN06084.1 hypothetical protein [Agriterribacter sp.]